MIVVLEEAPDRPIRANQGFPVKYNQPTRVCRVCWHRARRGRQEAGSVCDTANGSPQALSNLLTGTWQEPIMKLRYFVFLATLL